MILTAGGLGDAELVAAAIRYAESFDWPVFPTKPDKSPATANGFYDATIDPDRIRRLFKKAGSGCGIGLRCGFASRVWVLDLDVKNGGNGFRDLDEIDPRSFGFDGFSTVTAKTPSHGGHAFFACDEPELVRPRAHVDGTSIDTRGCGSYVCIAPTPGYEWINSPFDTPIQPAEPWLIAFAEKTGRKPPANGATPQGGLSLVYEGGLEDHPGVKQKGSRNDTLCRLVGEYLNRHGVTDDVLPLAIEWGARCDPKMDPAEVRKSVLSIIAKHCRSNPAGAKPTTALVLKPFNEIEPEDVEWLWPQRLALGKLSIICGDPGLGKTFVACDIAARVSTGTAFPDGTECDAGPVLIFTCEDGAADTLRPRLDACRADVSRVFHVEGVRRGDGEPGGFTIEEHLAELGAAIESVPGLRLIIVDPLSGHLGKVDSHRNAEVRSVLSPLCRLAERHRVSVLAIEHPTKSEKQSPIHRVQGSIAFVGAARSAWLVAEHPDDRERRVIVPLKNNLGTALGMSFLIGGDPPRVEWDDKPCELSAGELAARGPGRPSDTFAEATEWLQAQLAEGPVPYKQIMSAASAEGISKTTLHRARKSLGITPGTRDGAAVWYPPPSLKIAGETVGEDHTIEV